MAFSSDIIQAPYPSLFYIPLSRPNSMTLIIPSSTIRSQQLLAVAAQNNSNLSAAGYMSMGSQALL